MSYLARKTVRTSWAASTGYRHADHGAPRGCGGGDHLHGGLAQYRHGERARAVLGRSINVHEEGHFMGPWPRSSRWSVRGRRNRNRGRRVIPWPNRHRIGNDSASWMVTATCAAAPPSDKADFEGLARGPGGREAGDWPARRSPRRHRLGYAVSFGTSDHNLTRAGAATVVQHAIRAGRVLRAIKLREGGKVKEFHERSGAATGGFPTRGSTSRSWRTSGRCPQGGQIASSPASARCWPVGESTTSPKACRWRTSCAGSQLAGGLSPVDARRVGLDGDVTSSAAWRSGGDGALCDARRASPR